MKEIFRTFRKLARVRLHALRWLNITSLHLQNLFSKRSATGDGKVVVSMTTYGTRTSYVHLALESIARGTVRPRRIILWLDESDSVANPPKSLLRLARRGVEILPCTNFGPHKKYYPYVEAREDNEFEEPLVIVDDDFVYPASWLASLLESYKSFPEAVSCTRAHEMQVGEDPLPYSDWPACESDQPSVRTFATGVGGVLYPPKVLRAIKSQGTKFETCAPRADDVWLHYVTVSNGSLVRQILPKSLDLEFKILPFGQQTSLQAVNVGEGANDRQISDTYDAKTLEMIRASS